MKIIKESFIEDTPKVEVKQTQLGTECIFDSMSVATAACQLLSQLDYPLSDVKPVGSSTLSSNTNYSVTVAGNNDISKVTNLLSAYNFLVIF